MVAHANTLLASYGAGTDDTTNARIIIDTINDTLSATNLEGDRVDFAENILPTLNIYEFSCIKDASLEIAPVNIIIGPQGSGKSVTTKLLYFFADILSGYITYAERGETFDQYKRHISKQFSLWFPPSAWGPGRFNVNYTAGEFYIRVLRRTQKGQPSDEVSITFNDWFSTQYSNTREKYSSLRDSADIDSLRGAEFSAAIDRAWRVRDVVSRQILKDLGPEYISGQTFIPAGRAFFTSIGKLVAGFEQAGSLDPVTIRFARLFANLRDRNARRYIPRRMPAEFLERRNTFMHNLFGGEIKFENDLEFVETSDGRRIPFSSLSSGQQELLPMWALMDYFNELDALQYRGPGRPPRRARELVYIEEPEAHLFPSAQSLLMEFLIGSVTSGQNPRSLIITTHSPYIMGKINVFLKAGHLSRRKKRNQDINQIVPRECWLSDNQLSAFAINDGQLIDIMDREDHLIDGRYLDQISEDISRDFSKLLLIESEI